MDLAKRRDLLAQVRDYLARNGLADLSLRPLARSLGTSDRMLLYYFGTKERLVAEALALDEQRPLLQVRELFGTADRPRHAADLRRFMEELWQRLSDPERRASLPLLLEVMVASLLHPDRYGPLMRELVTEWTDLLSPVFLDFGMPSDRARTEASVLVDATVGLLVAPLADGDWDRAGAAFQILLDRLEPGWRAPDRDRRS
jgi:AcrR family transcriptional regulator